jgi:hypothetical protein
MVQYIGDGHNYFVIPASQTTLAIGPVGAKGDYLQSIITSGVGACTLFDGATAFMAFTPGSATVPTVFQIGAYSKNGAWNVTTPASTTITAIGRFS